MTTIVLVGVLVLWTLVGMAVWRSRLRQSPLEQVRRYEAARAVTTRWAAHERPEQPVAPKRSWRVRPR